MSMVDDLDFKRNEAHNLSTKIKYKLTHYGKKNLDGPIEKIIMQ